MSADQQREMARVKALAITFGAELRCRRQAAGLQQRDLADRIGYDRSYVSQVESGRQVPAEQFALLCERELATGGVLLDMFRELLAERESQRQAQHVERWRAKTAKGGDVAQPAKAFGWEDVWLASGDATALPSPVESAEDSDTGAAVLLDGGTITDRRDALLLGIRLGGLVISENMLELLGTKPLEMARALGTSSASARTVDYFEVTAESLMVEYELSGPISLFKPTFQHFRQIRQPIQERQSPALQLRLCRPAAQLATLMGIFTYEDKVRARAWFHAAQRAADEAGDNGLHAWALVKESLVPCMAATLVKPSISSARPAS